MRAVAIGTVRFGDTQVPGGEFTVWELPPARRTIIGTTVEDDDWVAKRFFVPFPYTYMIVGYRRGASGVIGRFLAVGFRPTPPTPTDRKIHVIPMANAPYGIVCLGNAWNDAEFFSTEEEMARAMISAFFTSQFEGTDIVIPLVRVPGATRASTLGQAVEASNVLNFGQWAEFKDFQSIQADWKSMAQIPDAHHDAFNSRSRAQANWDMLWAMDL